jgi:hypothetical protein
MSAESVALDHYSDRQKLVAAIAAVAKESWSSLDVAALDASWAQLARELLLILSATQLAAARAADPYLDDALAEQDIDPASSGSLVSSSYAGIASDGRELETLLAQPVITTKAAIGDGAETAIALASGYATLDMMVRTQVADAGRSADQTALTGRKHAGGYVRMTLGKSCSRCIILAGRRYGWNAGFRRHPRIPM